MRRVMLLAAGLLAALAALRMLVGPAAATTAAPERAAGAGGDPTLASAGAATAPAPAVRTMADAGPPAAVTVDFAAAVARLVELALRGVQEVAQDQLARAKATDTEAWELVEAVLRDVPDFDSKALFALSALDPRDGQRAEATRGVLAHFLRFALQKHAATARAGVRPPLDGYLDALLELMVPDQATAGVVTGLLADQPHLQAPQEAALLRLTDLVPTYPWLTEPLRRLLLTLWHNLRESGARARDDIETLALMLKDDANPARRSAALEQLLTSPDRGLMEFVLQDIEEQRDGSRARDLARAAAAKLPVPDALAVLRRLRPLSPSALVAPALDLASRDAAQVRAVYGDLLAAGQDAGLRADLVSGLGFHPTGENVALVRTALREDPSPDVRVRALLALTANAGTAIGEQVVAAAMDDSLLCGRNGERLGAIVAALENLARSGEHAAVERLGARLAGRRDLPPAARSDLETLLRQGPAPRPR